MSQTTLSIKRPAADAPRFRARLTEAGFDFRDLAHAFWQARAPGLIVSFYRSGKVVFQGRAAEVWVEELTGEAPPTKAPKTSASTSTSAGSPNPGGRWGAALAKLPAPAPTAWIGIDETGKGDFFGPLCACAARVDLDQIGWLAEVGVGDSKKLTDKKVLTIADRLRDAIPHEVVRIGPARYNQLYAEFGNLNKLLAWAQAKAADTLLERVDAELILSDQFAKAEIVPRYFGDRAKALRYQQRTKAEDDPAVAVASIFARAAFVRAMARLSREIGVDLAKGAGSPVIAAAHRLVAQKGEGALAEVAKLHFKTTKQVAPSMYAGR